MGRVTVSKLLLQLSRVLEERARLRPIETLGSRLHYFRSFSCRNYRLFLEFSNSCTLKMMRLSNEQQQIQRME